MHKDFIIPLSLGVFSYRYHFVSHVTPGRLCRRNRSPLFLLFFIRYDRFFSVLKVNSYVGGLGNNVSGVDTGGFSKTEALKRLSIQWASYPEDILCGNMCVDHRCLKILVP